VGCFRFDGTLKDESPAALAAAGRNVAFAPGLDGQALSVRADTRVQVPETRALDVAELTIELWVQPRALPAGLARMGLVDNQEQYGLFVYAGGAVRCSGGGDAVLAPGAVAAGRWTSLACVIGAATLSLHVDGAPVASTPRTTPLPTVGTQGLAIGGNNPGVFDDSPDAFDGLIDNLRLWSRARPPRDLCPATRGCRP
jgi:hypothetical protein